MVIDEGEVGRGADGRCWGDLLHMDATTSQGKGGEHEGQRILISLKVEWCEKCLPFPFLFLVPIGFN